MEISFEHSFPALYLLLALALASGLSFWLYYKNPQNESLTLLQRWILIFLRFWALFLIFIFLLSPVSERIKKIRQKPILAVAFDNSQSASSFTPQIQDFKQSIQEKFARQYQLEFWSFGEKVSMNDQFSGNERRSDYSSLLQTLKSNYFNQNIGALIVAGDGIYNQGQNPSNLAASLKFPVYTIGIGDTTSYTDAAIRNVRTNKVTFLKNKFPIEIELKFSKLKDQIAYLEIENNQKVVFSTSFPVTSNDDFKLEMINLVALNPGLQHYKLRIKSFSDEVNLKNNEYEFVIQVLENKQKILVLSESVHPDIGALRSSVSELQNYEFKVVTGDILPDSLSSYSLVVLNQLPTAKNTISSLSTVLKSGRIPLFFIIGPNTLLDQFNALDLGLSISSSQNTEEVQAFFDDNFSLFTLRPETKELFSTAPPLVAPFGNTQLQVSVQNLATQNIRNVQVGKSLFAFGNYKGRKTGFIVGEGLWRWRLYGYQVNGNHDAFDELAQKMIQYLALRENEDNFNVYHPALYQETDPIELTAELFNDSYELINTPDVELTVKDDSLKEYTFLFDRTNNFYRLNAGTMRPGDYTFEAKTQLGNQLFTEKGSFSILKNDIETQNTRADFSVLNQLAERSGGKFYTIEKYGTLLDEISQNKEITVQIHRQSIQTEWINLKSFFVLLILILGVEWFLRKFWGIY